MAHGLRLGSHPSEWQLKSTRITTAFPPPSRPETPLQTVVGQHQIPFVGGECRSGKSCKSMGFLGNRWQPFRQPLCKVYKKQRICWQPLILFRKKEFFLFIKVQRLPANPLVFVYFTQRLPERLPMVARKTYVFCTFSKRLLERLPRKILLSQGAWVVDAAKGRSPKIGEGGSQACDALTCLACVFCFCGGCACSFQ
jgi:hypothetical protein